MAHQNYLSRTDNLHIQKVALVADEQFRKSHGDPIPIHKIINNEGFRHFAQEKRFVLTKLEDRQYLKTFIEDVIRHTPRLEVLYYMKPHDHDNVYRNNKYKVKNDKDLQKLIDEHPEGIQVGEELLKYTYRKIQADLVRLYRENSYRKIYFKKPWHQNGASFIVFPKKQEKLFDQLVPFPNEHDKIFDYHKYLQICSRINSAETGGEYVEYNRKNNYKESATDPNYKLEGYKELKERWLSLNNKK